MGRAWGWRACAPLRAKVRTLTGGSASPPATTIAATVSVPAVAIVVVVVVVVIVVVVVVVVVVVAIAMSADGASIVIAFEYEGIC